jgi:hypothetical protein
MLLLQLVLLSSQPKQPCSLPPVVVKVVCQIAEAEAVHPFL